MVRSVGILCITIKHKGFYSVKYSSKGGSYLDRIQKVIWSKPK